MKQPKFQRRAEDRPREICSAALEVFAEKGFAAAKLDEIARRSGVSKGTLYLYFEDKEQLFRAVVRDTIAPNVETLRAALIQTGLPFAELIRLFVSDAPKQMRLIEGAYGKRDPEGLRESAHFLRSGALANGQPQDLPDFRIEKSRKPFENDDWSPFPNDATSRNGQPPPSIRGFVKPNPRGLKRAQKVWREAGYKGQ